MEWIVGGGFVGIVAIMLGIAKFQDVKIDRAKVYQEDVFVRKDICDLTHKQVAETLSRIEAKIDELSKSKDGH